MWWGRRRCGERSGEGGRGSGGVGGRLGRGECGGVGGRSSGGERSRGGSWALGGRGSEWHARVPSVGSRTPCRAPVCVLAPALPALLSTCLVADAALALVAAVGAVVAGMGSRCRGGVGSRRGGRPLGWALCWLGG